MVGSSRTANFMREGIHTLQEVADRGADKVSCIARGLLLVMLLAALAVPSIVSARQASPVATPAAIDPGACTVKPRPTAQMRELIQAGLPPIVAFMAGTPTARGDATPRAAMGDGEPADEATVAAVTEVVLQWLACTNAGDLPAVAAVLTEQGAATYLSIAFLPFRAAYEGEMSTPTAEVDPDLLNLFLGAIQPRVSLPSEFQGTLFAIESVTQMEDGQVRVVALLATGTDEPRKITIPLREEEGRYRIIFADRSGSDAESTPVP